MVHPDGADVFRGGESRACGKAARQLKVLLDVLLSRRIFLRKVIHELKREKEKGGVNVCEREEEQAQEQGSNEVTKLTSKIASCMETIAQCKCAT